MFSLKFWLIWCIILYNQYWLILSSSCGREEESSELPLCVIFHNEEELKKVMNVQPSELSFKVVWDIFLCFFTFAYTPYRLPDNSFGHWPSRIPLFLKWENWITKSLLKDLWISIFNRLIWIIFNYCYVKHKVSIKTSNPLVHLKTL